MIWEKTEHRYWIMNEEYRKICLEELDFLVNARKKNESELDKVIQKFVPEKLNETLRKAFCKAFEIILKNGTGILRSTLYDREQKNIDDAQMKSKIAGLFDKALTFAEGAGFGIIGLGLPDIPVFTSMVIRNIYQKAAFYGFDYSSETEQVYVLKLIAGASASGKDAERLSLEVDKLADNIDNGGFVYFGIPYDYIKEASDSIADDMIYMKFVQGIPFVGAIGGIYNAATINKIDKYAEFKYHKRRLLMNGVED